MTITRKKTHLIQVPLNEALFNKVQQYMLDNDHDSMADAARALFREGTETPAYIAIQKERLASRASMTPEDRVRQSVEKEQARANVRESIALTKQTMICTALGGTVSDDGYCKYPQFVEDMGKEISVYPQSEPLESLSEKHKDFQFMSSFSDDRTPYGQRERIYLIASEPKNSKINLPK